MRGGWGGVVRGGGSFLEKAGGDIEGELTSDPRRNSFKCHPVSATAASAVRLQLSITSENRSIK